MQQHQSAGRFVRFGSFEVDLAERKLTKMGSRVRLQDQPFRILTLLLERPGEVVTREELRQELWPQDVYVEFDAALNTAVRKLRDALKDSADNPMFLETVPRQGYRFVAPVSWPLEAAERMPITSRMGRYVFLSVAAALILTSSAILAIRHFSHRSLKITPEDTIVLADFANSTGDEVFDDTLNTGAQARAAPVPFLQNTSRQR